MIRRVGKWRLIAVATVLVGTAASQFALGQFGYQDEAPHVPPSPSQPYPTAAPQRLPGAPAPAVSSPVDSASNLTPAPAKNHMPAWSNPKATFAQPSANRSAPQKLGPFGVGGKAPPKTVTGAAVGQAQATGATAGQRVTPVGHASTQGRVTPVHYGDIDNRDFSNPVPPPVEELPQPLFMKHAAPIMIPGSAGPSERMRPPTILGSHLGLQPGETATERSLRLMTAVGELERQVDALGQRNAELTQQVKQRDDQLQLAIREFKSTRKEVTSAREELEHLRQQVQALQDKVRDAERDNASLIQTMAPLLQRLLEPEGPAPEKSEE